MAHIIGHCFFTLQVHFGYSLNPRHVKSLVGISILKEWERSCKAQQCYSVVLKTTVLKVFKVFKVE